ncbi:MAG: MbnP family protein [Bacteroidota bacterium]
MNTVIRVVFAFVLLLSSAVGRVFAQQSTTVIFHTCLNKQRLAPMNYAHGLNPFDSIRIDNLRFYIGGVSFEKKDGFLLYEDRKPQLVDTYDTVRNRLILKGLSSSDGGRLCVQLGLDSIQNTTGIQSGELDPVMGMYWTWQSGFIHFKLEGEAIDSVGNQLKFQYHLGGYRTPFAVTQKVCIDLKSLKDTLHIAVELNNVLTSELLLRQPKLMSPGPDAVRIFGRIADSFQVMPNP